MTSPQKSVKQFIKEMREAGFEFESMVTGKDGYVKKSDGWKDDDRVYREATPYVAPKLVKHEKKNR